MSLVEALREGKLLDYIYENGLDREEQVQLIGELLWQVQQSVGYEKLDDMLCSVADSLE